MPIILYYSSILYLLFIFFSVECKQRKLQSEISYINLKINKTGEAQFLHVNLGDIFMPNEIYINGVNLE